MQTFAVVLGDMDHTSQLVIACAAVMEEMRPLLPPDMPQRVFDFGLHTTPKRLHTALQEAIDEAGRQFNTIILGYGLCSLAIAGITARHCRVAIPRVDDCISIFMGSRHAYIEQFNAHPGTYYLTKGWMEVGDTPFREYERNIEKYGQDKASAIYEMMMASYTRLVLIRTGTSDMDAVARSARATARRFNLAFEEMQGSDELIRKLLFGPWDDDILVLAPGEQACLEQFLPLP